MAISRFSRQIIYITLAAGMVVMVLSLQHPATDQLIENTGFSSHDVPPQPTLTPARASTLVPAHPWFPKATKTAPVMASSPEPSQWPSEADTEEIPEFFYITGFDSHPQWFSIGCEASAAVDWAKYFGVLINEREFQELLPVSDNPDSGFVGDVNGVWGLVPPDDYGVHAEPVADLLRWYGLNAVAVRGLSLDEVKASIAHEKPVIAWVIGNVTYGKPVEYTDSQGNVTIVAAYEHVVILTGYNAESIRYENNGATYDVSNRLFMESWGVLGNMAIIAKED